MFCAIVVIDNEWLSSHKQHENQLCTSPEAHPNCCNAIFINLNVPLPYVLGPFACTHCGHSIPIFVVVPHAVTFNSNINSKFHLIFLNYAKLISCTYVRRKRKKAHKSNAIWTGCVCVCVCVPKISNSCHFNALYAFPWNTSSIYITNSDQVANTIIYLFCHCLMQCGGSCNWLWFRYTFDFVSIS